jgi:hypothetical protein
MRDILLLLAMPDSRAFQGVRALTVDLQESDLQPGCWGALGLFLSVSTRRWPDIKDVRLYGEDGMNLSEE